VRIVTPEQASLRLVTLAHCLDGLTARSDPDKYGRACAPNGPPSARVFFCVLNVAGGANSPCEAVAVGALTVVLGEAGCTELQEPFDVTGATGQWHRATTLGDLHGAHHSPENPGAGLRPGCIVHVEGVSGRHWILLFEDLGLGKWRALEGTLLGGIGTIRIVDVDIPGGVFDRTSQKPVKDWIDTGELFESLLGAEEDPSDSNVDGSADAFAAGEVA
jgi:hypothetical protein